MPLRVLLKSPFSPFTGYGNDGLGIVKALLKMGIDVTLDPVVVTPPVTPEVAALLTKGIDPPYDLVIHTADPASFGISTQYQRLGHKTVLWTMWEWTSLGDLETKVRKNVVGYDLVVSYDRVSDGALHFVPQEQRAILQGGYEPEPWAMVDSESRDWDGTFKFCMVGALTPRKNPMAVVQAFKELKEQYGDVFDAELHLKNSARTLHPGMERWVPGLKIHYAQWDIATLREFYRMCHCYVAPSTGEGKNMPALEAVTTGLPIILSRCGGHESWADESFAYFIDGVWEPVVALEPQKQHMVVDVQSLKAQMWDVYTDREKAKQRGYRGSQEVQRTRPWDAVVPRLIDLAMRAKVARPVEATPGWQHG